MPFPKPSHQWRETIPAYFDYLAKHNPTRVWASIPKNPLNISDGFRDINYREAVRAINRTCEIIEREIGINRTDEESIVCYTGLSDPRVQITTVALQKTGHCALSSAPKNSTKMHTHLFDQTKCNTVLYSTGIDLKQVVGDRPMKMVQIPSVEELIEDNGKEPKVYTFDKSYEEVRTKPICIVHTSGSTGMPKPIPITYGYVNVSLTPYYSKGLIDGIPQVWSMTEGNEKTRVYVMFPPFHVAGIALLGFAYGVLAGFIYVFGPPHLPPTNSVMKDVLRYGNIRSMAAAPGPLLDAAYDEESLELLSKLHLITYGGGPMNVAAGNIIAKVVKFTSQVGATEYGRCGIQLMKYGEEGVLWEYIRFSPDEPGMRFESRGGGVYELVFYRDEGDSLDRHPVWQLFPDQKVFYSKDLFSFHPDPKFSHLARYEYRTDDMIVFATADKYSPCAYEDQIAASPLVTGVVMFGDKKMFPALLIELRESAAPNSARYMELLNKIWPTVQAANINAPKNAVITKDMILLAYPDKPFERAAKMTIIRKRTTELYASEIEALYRRRNQAAVEDSQSAIAADGSLLQTARLQKARAESAPKDIGAHGEAAPAAVGTSGEVARANELLMRTNETLEKMTDMMGRLFDIMTRMEGMSHQLDGSTGRMNGSAMKGHENGGHVRMAT